MQRLSCPLVRVLCIYEVDMTSCLQRTCEDLKDLY